MTKITLDKSQTIPIPEEQKQQIYETLDKEIHVLKEIESEIQGIIYNTNISEGTSPQIDKIKSNLSVKDLALLFKLLAEEKLIEVPNVSSLSRTISQCFYTDKSPEISPKSFKNQYDDPKQTAIDNLFASVVNMKQNLQKKK